MGRSLHTRAWTERRRRWATRLPVDCLRCGQPVHPWQPWDLDHPTPRALGGNDDDARPAHRACNRQAGGELSTQLTRLGAQLARAQLNPDAGHNDPEPIITTTNDPHDDDEKTAEFFPGRRYAARTTPAAAIPARSPETPPDDGEPEPTTLGPEDPAWDGCEWLAGLRVVPSEASWPRLMSGPHPRAVGSYGGEAVDWLRESAGLDLRWWQRLVLTRALEHDAEGRLVWIEVDVSTPRQVGKSVTMRGLATWRIHQEARFGEPQTVLHTGKDLPVCKEVMRPARVWARTVGGYKVREQNGSEEIATGESRWIVRGRFSVYGYPAAVGLVDECWGVEPEIVEDGVEPTLGDRVDPQLWLVSTAHRRTTALFPLRREAAIAAFDEPDSTLILEWSAPAETSIEDREAWRAASPHWSPMRERLLSAKLARVLRGISADPDEDDPVESFRSQYLNVWPRRVLVTSLSEEPLVTVEEWTANVDLAAVLVAGEPCSVAVEDWFGLGAAVMVAGLLPDGRTLVTGDVFPDRDSALAWAAWVVDDRPSSVLVAGTSVPVDVVRDACPDVTVEKATPAGQRSGLALVRMLTRQGRIVHGGDPALAAQLAKTRVTQREGGLVIPHRAHRTDLVRAMAAAVRSSVEGSVAVPVARPAIY